MDSESDLKAADPPSGLKPWQSPSCFLLVLIAVAAVMLGVGIACYEQTFWMVMVLAVIIVASLAYQQPSPNIRLLGTLMLIQFVGGALLQPGDCGMWFSSMCRLYLAVDIFLFGRLHLFYRITRRPEPQLPELTQVAIITSPIWMGVIATYLMEHYKIFR